ncbi:MAG: helix-turn-helix transcriptional regulator [Candidatus Taylorbacteria bacterium]
MTTKIKEFRIKNAITQEVLANEVGVRRETIVFLEKGKYNPSLRLAFLIAKALNESIENIFFFDDEI